MTKMLWIWKKICRPILQLCIWSMRRVKRRGVLFNVYKRFFIFFKFLKSF